MTFHPYGTRVPALWLLIGCALLTTLHARVVLADNSAGSRPTAIVRDVELVPLMEAKASRPRYAGWLLSAYLVAPVVAVGGVVAESNVLLVASAASIWIAPAMVHLFAGEYGLAARTTLVLAFAAGGALVGGLIGLGAAAIAGQNRADREEDPGINRVIGLLLGGALGLGVGILSWAIIDISGTFARDAARRDYTRSGLAKLEFSVSPSPSGLTGSLSATF